MSKKQEAMKVLTDRNLIDPLTYLLKGYHEKTNLSPKKYYKIRYELAVKNNNHDQAKEALGMYQVYQNDK